MDNKIKIAAILALALMANSAHAAPVGLSIGGGRITGEVKSFKELKTQNIITQSLDYSCGPAAIATILRYYFNDNVAEKDIIAYLLLTANLEKVKKRRGFSMLDLKRYVKAKGYEAVGYQMDINFLVDLGRPVLIPINIKDYDHFVVFRGAANGRIFLADPVLGKVAMRTDKFMNIWKGGIGLVLNKPGYNINNAPILLSREEDQYLTDSAYIQRVLSQSALGKVFAEGEF